MARLNGTTISRRTVEALPVGERETVFWDHELSGFGVRVYPSGTKVYLVQTRSEGKSRRVTIGRHGVLSAEQARRKAAQFIANIKTGEEPARPTSPPDVGPTIAEVVERYMREHVATLWTGIFFRRSAHGHSAPSGAKRSQPCNTACTRRQSWPIESSTCSPGFSTWPRRGGLHPREEIPAGS